MKQSLPGIRRIAYVDCSLPPSDITLRALSGVPIGIYTTVTEIYKVGSATCETETTFDNNSSIEKTTLTFRTLDDVPTHRRIAFVLTTISGNTYIIGTKEQPYPTVKITGSSGSPDGDAAVRKYEVSFTAKKSLVLCTV